MMGKSHLRSPSYDQLLALVPQGADWRIDWDAIWSLWPELTMLDDCPQDPLYHGEGDVGTHTRMVVEALVADPDWQALSDADRRVLFWSAVLHDVGKPATTRHEEDGRITSRGHSRVGAHITRELLWRANVPFAWREQICGLIAAHQLPFWLIERPDPQRLAIETSWRCRPDLLCLHAKADALGRICADQQAALENVALAQAVFEEAGCFREPFPFANDESRVAYFELPDRDQHYAAFEDHRCTVTVMSALPGTGKDTWIARNRADQPVVSLDLLRGELGVNAPDNQGRVIQAAYARAKEYLRAGRDFTWNATNVTRQTRGKLLRLLRDYNARIELVYLEAGPDRIYQQNGQRADAVPEAVIDHLLRKLEPPDRTEAHLVTIITG